MEPPATHFAFPSVETADDKGRVAVGGDLQPGTLLAGYRSGLFPMRQSSGEMTWWSPDPRGVLLVENLVVHRSLRQSCRRFVTTVDQCFDDVVAGCADRSPEEYFWITDEIRAAYGQLHSLGWAHSIETWTRGDDGQPQELVGGLYGVAIGGFFSGESMFHRSADASKAALIALVELLRRGSEPQNRLIDVQWLTPHMASLGAVEIPRHDYQNRLAQALRLPLPPLLAAPHEAP